MKANGQGFHPLFEKNYVGQFFTLFLDTFLKKNIFLGLGVGHFCPKYPLGHDLSGPKKNSRGMPYFGFAMGKTETHFSTRFFVVGQSN